MIIPSIDLEGGQTVQLVGGEGPALEAGDPRPILKSFALAGEVAVVDLDAAKGEGSNADLMRDLCRRASVRVGGGVRDVATAMGWLNAGAQKVVIGTAANPELLSQLPPERVVVALDALRGEVVTHGWRQPTGAGVRERMAELRGLCGGFLVTFVEREGRLGGTDLDEAQGLVEAAGDTRVTIAGGVSTLEEIATLDSMGADAQVGMALYRQQLLLGDAIGAPLVTDRPDGLFPTVVTDERGVALGLAYSSRESLREAVATRRGIYHSRKRGLWRKGASSGAVQELLSVDLDCDRDALRFTVRQEQPGFCHRETRCCWGDDSGLGRLERRLRQRMADGDRDSNTVRLARDSTLLNSKLLEEAAELAEAETQAEVQHEAADLVYFALVRALTKGVSLADIEKELDQRELIVTRRSCEKKELR
ncbi:MAG: phosphoribosyl-ATP pyrophosphohydrolase/phosphoribosyl-AMP cyclohydrolase [Gammaproteobacteria bacterium]|jgi:phosphoribosyl-ATP pyrophosphohydrolase/phosphoribosyl-AMP cyclohydrolase